VALLALYTNSTQRERVLKQYTKLSLTRYQLQACWVFDSLVFSQQSYRKIAHPATEEEEIECGARNKNGGKSDLYLTAIYTDNRVVLVMSGKQTLGQLRIQKVRIPAGCSRIVELNAEFSCTFIP
jgi:hypothetical protein